ncbi:MAG TPA: phosphatidate cytidylyltransferase [Rhizomicrobium sp.]|nr:phosphatidate cytidylyltransferase [Rhizomicrobium sp.]
MNGAAESTVPESAPERKAGGIRANFDWLWRPLFGIGLAALATGAAWEGKWYFAAFLAAGSVAGVREWHRIFLKDGYGAYFIVSALAIVGALLAQNTAPLTHERDLPWAVLAVGALIDLGMFRARNALWHMAGPFYVGVPPLSLLILRQVHDERYGMPHSGFWLVLAVFLAVWVTDTGAMIAGKLIGGPKLSPKLSPNKTWAGAFGGALSAIALTAALFAALGASVLNGALFGLAMSVVGQVGDLFESWIKRRAGRKDSGSLIPGHGGVLDRIDSILFVAPVATFVVVVLGLNPLVAP